MRYFGHLFEAVHRIVFNIFPKKVFNTFVSLHTKFYCDTKTFIQLKLFTLKKGRCADKEKVLKIMVTKF